MHILFIGGTGNISTECAALLHQNAHRIAVLTRGQKAIPAEYEAIRANRTDLAEMRSALKSVKPDVVINFLGYDRPEVMLDYELFNGTIQQYIFISSATVYAKPHRQIPITESAPLGNEWSEYARKKLACEEWLMDAWRDKRFPVTIIRPSHTYSKRWVPNPVSSSSYTFASRIEQRKPVFVPDDGNSLWTLTAASDFASGLAGLVGQNTALGEACHITSDEVLTWNQICLEIAAAVGVNDPIIEKVPTDLICKAAPELTGTIKGDKAHTGVFDNTKIKRAVSGFKCVKPFREGIRESVAWLRAHPSEQNLSQTIDSLIEKVLTEKNRQTLAL